MAYFSIFYTYYTLQNEKVLQFSVRSEPVEPHGKLPQA